MKPADAEHGHQRSAPWFAALYDPVMRPFEQRLFGPWRKRLLAAIEGEVLDIGAGTGANFPYFAEAIHAGLPLRLTALEPDPDMAKRARRRADELELPLALVSAPAEALPFPDASFDRVVATLVLCSVADPIRCLAEFRRVLRPGGELLYLEHVRGTSVGARAQDALRPAWAVIGAGCQINRPTGELIAEAGFTQVTSEEVVAPFPLLRVLIGRAQA